MFKVMIDNGADLEGKDGQGYTALHHAAWTDDQPLITLLLDQGANIETKSARHETALHMIGSPAKLEALRCLIDRGADINATALNEVTALHKAAFYGAHTLIELLHAKGALINKQTSYGSTALHLAVNGNSEELQKFGGPKTSGNPRMTSRDDERSTRTVQLLLAQNADPNIRDKSESTALKYAASNGKGTAISLLLDHGAEPDMQDQAGATALHRAICNSHNDSAMLLMDGGANVTVELDCGWSALHYAVLTDNTKMIEVLLQRGADINALDASRQTVLHLAASKGWKDATETLLRHTDIINANDIKGNTPLHLVGQRMTTPPNTASLSISPSSGNRALEDYQMQLMFLEQQKKRLMLKHPDPFSRLMTAYPKIHSKSSTVGPSGNHAQPHLQTRNEKLRIWAEQAQDMVLAYIPSKPEDHEAVAMMLIERGPIVEIGEYDRSVMLTLAAQNGNERLVHLLLVYGVNANRKDNSEKRARHWVIGTDLVSVDDILRGYGEDFDVPYASGNGLGIH